MTLSAKARNTLTVALFAFAFVDIVFGGVVRASEGMEERGFIQSAFSAIVVVCCIFLLPFKGQPAGRPTLWAALAVLASGAGALLSPESGELPVATDRFAILALASPLSPQLSSISDFRGWRKKPWTNDRLVACARCAPRLYRGNTDVIPASQNEGTSHGEL